MPENFSYTPDTPDKKLYSKGVFEPETYDSAYEFRTNPPKNTPTINPQKDTLTAIRKRESATRGEDQTAAAKLLQWFDSGTNTQWNNIVEVNENHGWVKLQWDWNKAKNEFTWIYGSPFGDKFEWRGKMRPSNPFPIPIEWRLTQKDGTILLGKFHPPASKTLMEWTRINPDGSSITGKFGPDGVPTKIFAQKWGKSSPDTVVETWESPNSILVNIGLLDPNTRINPKSMNPKEPINPKGPMQPWNAPRMFTWN